MKKILVIISLFILSGLSMHLFSQSLSVGIKGGLSFSNMLEESDFGEFSEDLDYKFIQGYNFGLYIEASASPDLVGEAGIGFTSFGYKIETETVTGNLKANFLVIPLKAKTIHNLGFIDVFASGGVYGGLALSGTSYLNTDITGEITEDIAFGDDPDNDDMQKIDYGVVGSVGLMVKGIVLEVSYLHGLANLALENDVNYVMSNRSFTLSLGYMYSF